MVDKQVETVKYWSYGILELDKYYLVLMVNILLTILWTCDMLFTHCLHNLKQLIKNTANNDLIHNY